MRADFNQWIISLETCKLGIIKIGNLNLKVALPLRFTHHLAFLQILFYDWISFMTLLWSSRKKQSPLQVISDYPNIKQIPRIRLSSVNLDVNRKHHEGRLTWNIALHWHLWTKDSAPSPQCMPVKHSKLNNLKVQTISTLTLRWTFKVQPMITICTAFAPPFVNFTYFGKLMTLFL